MTLSEKNPGSYLHFLTVNRSKDEFETRIRFIMKITMNIFTQIAY